MITLSNGHSFNYMTASGAMGYDGLGWPWEWPLRWTGAIDPSLFTQVTKTLTWRPTVGNLRWWNPLRCIRVWADGTLNAVGLTNPGWHWWEDKVARRYDWAWGAKQPDLALVVSITGKDWSELETMAYRLTGYKIVGIEFNPFCPNTVEGRERTVDQVLDGCHVIREAAPNVPLLVKLSVDQPWRKIVPRLAGVEALSINSVSWRRVYGSRRSPLAHLGGGGVSGRAAQAHNWPLISELVQMTDIPVIGCSVWNYGDLAKLWGMGVKAISFGAVHIPFPTRPTWMVRREQQERSRNHVRIVQCKAMDGLASRTLV